MTTTSVDAWSGIRTLNVVLSEYVGTDVPRLEFSVRESEKFGLRVARLTVPVDCPRSDRELAAMCESAPFDLIFVRAPVQRAGLAAELSQAAGREIRPVESLVYYEWDLAQASTMSRQLRFFVGNQVKFPLLEPLIRDAFSGYKNHYSANYHFSAAAAVDAYVEWARTLLEESSCRILVAYDEPSGELVGFVLSVVNFVTRSAEIVLNGVSSSWQRQGVYSGLMITAASQLRNVDGVQRLAISTQSTNIPVIAAWEKLGLRELICLNTFHFARSS